MLLSEILNETIGHVQQIFSVPELAIPTKFRKTKFGVQDNRSSELASQAEDAKGIVEKWIGLSWDQSARVQMIGTSTRIPIEDIYVPTALTPRSPYIQPSHGAAASESIPGLILSGEDAVISAGPGFGKTTFLHHSFRELLLNDRSVVPLLIALRWPGAVRDLGKVVEVLRQLATLCSHEAAEARRHNNELALKKIMAPRPPLVLLVDGYDEVDTPERERVSSSLATFRSLGLGRIYVTCRTSYEVSGLNIQHYELVPFDHERAGAFIKRFAKAHGVEIDDSVLLEDLERQELASFGSHPLLLSLVCLVRLSSDQIPKRVIDLIKQATDLLSFGWDYSKHIKRESSVGLMAHQRMNLLKVLAYKLPYRASAYAVESNARQYLDMLQMFGVDEREVLRELAQWFGLLVPIGFQEWQFVHRTIQDYLAASYGLETGLFSSGPVREWNTRAIYCVCLMPDATAKITELLHQASDISMFRECLESGPVFDYHVVARAVIQRLGKSRDYKLERCENSITVETKDDFYEFASNDFLRILIVTAGRCDNPECDVIALYALSESLNRNWNSRQIPITKLSVGDRLAAFGDYHVTVARRRGTLTFQPMRAYIH